MTAHTSLPHLHIHIHINTSDSFVSLSLHVMQLARWLTVRYYITLAITF